MPPSFRVPLLAALLLPAPLLSAPAAAQSAIDFAIPAQPLPTALVAFYRQSGVQLLYDAAIAEGRQSPGLSGRATPEEALRRLLVGTGLGFRFTAPGVVTLTPPPAREGALELPEVSVQGARATSTMGAPLPALPGGQVASGQQMGLLGRREVMDTPFSSQAFTQRFIADSQAQSVADVVSSDPAVRLGDPTNNGNANSFSMRGIFLGNGSIGFDGMYGLAPNSQTTLIGIERVEVLRGPAAFLSGMSPSGVGGVINLVPKRAEAEPLAELTLDYLSDSRLGTRIDYGRRFGAQQEWGVRLNGQYRDGRTSVNGQSQELGAATLGLDYRGERLRLSADLGYQSLQTDRANITITPAAGQGVAAPPDPRRSYVSPWNFTQLQDSYGAVRAEYDILPDLTAFAAAGTSHTDWNQVLDQGTAVLPNGNFLSTANYNQITIDRRTGELGLRGRFRTGPVQHSVSLGYSAYWAIRDSAGGLALSSIRSNLYNPVFNPAPFLPRRTPTRQSDTVFQSLALADTMSVLDERIQLTVGARRQDISVSNYATATGAKTSGYEQDVVTPVVGLVVKPWRNVSLYASYIEALQQGTVVAQTYRNGGETLAPYVSKQYEAGAKFDLGVALATISAFQITQESGIADAATNSFRAEGEQRFRGTELTIAGEPLPGFRLVAGAMFLDAEQSKTQGGLYDGRRVLGVARTNLNLTGEWDPAFVPNLTLSARAIYTGNNYADAANKQSLGASTTVDLGARYVIERAEARPIVLRAAVRNVFDTRYWTLYPGFSLLNQNEARTYVVSATFSF
ncbi:TonB-dependent receptor [Roseomonas sp. 18066]|uniref:TonB-dependent receptor n=1 Tax=Roseomonas sp. 18066 TaxID=2681412 RepID=UPI00135CB7BF|nr:TonB-dependent receptor [Roseomonas sp. 18066]